MSGLSKVTLQVQDWEKFRTRKCMMHEVTPVTSPFKVMSKVKPNGNISGLEFSQYVCFSLCGNFGWDIANSKFDLENSRSRSWPSWNLMVTLEFNRCLNFVSWRSDHFWLRYSKSNIWPKKFQGQGQIQWSHLRPSVLSICLLFISWQSYHFWLSYNKFLIWPWKFTVKVMAKVKSDGATLGLEFNQWVCFLFRGNWTIFSWDKANSIFDLSNSRSRSQRKSTQNLIMQSICHQSCHKWKKSEKLFKSYRVIKSLRPAAAVAYVVAYFPGVY